MKKLITILLCGILSTSVFAGEDSTTVSHPNFKITKHWELNTWDRKHLEYIIENPTHSELNFLIEINLETKDQQGKKVPSAGIVLTCGEQIFHFSEHSPAIAVCKTKDNITFTLESMQSYPSSGKFVLQQ